MATAQGTWTYRDRFGDRFGRTYFRRFGPGVAASVGVGTYRGEATDAVDARYAETVRLALDNGVNHVDTASNYRCGRSEPAVREGLDRTDVPRERVVLASKAGFLPFDGTRPDDPATFVRERYVETGLVAPDAVACGNHCLAPDYLEWALDRSLDRLGVNALDLYYVHNPETQLAARDREAVYDQLTAAFTVLERRRAAGDLWGYGVASWDAFRVPPDDDAHLDLERVLAAARTAAARVHGDADAGSGADASDDRDASDDAAAESDPNANGEENAPDGTGETHGLRAVQLPFNVRWADAFTVPAHTHGDERVTALEFAHRERIAVVASAALAGGELATSDAIPDAVARELAGDTPAQRAITFARSAPAVRCALVGTTNPEHLRENVASGTFDPMGAEQFDRVFE